jgi:hypothetical protein
MSDSGHKRADEIRWDTPSHMVIFEEGETVVGEIPARTLAAIEEADRVAWELTQEGLAQGARCSAAALSSFEKYVQKKVKNERSDVNLAEVVGDLVEAAVAAISEEVPVLGIVLKHMAIAILDKASEQVDLVEAAGDLTTKIGRLDINSPELIKLAIEDHRAELRDAYLAATGSRAQRREAMKGAMARAGIGIPTPGAGKAIFQSLVTRLNIDAWIESCRHGNGRAAACASDAMIPYLAADARNVADATFADQEKALKKAEEEAQKRRAMPRS